MASHAKSVIGTVGAKLPKPANDNLDPNRRVPWHRHWLRLASSVPVLVAVAVVQIWMARLR